MSAREQRRKEGERRYKGIGRKRVRCSCCCPRCRFRKLTSDWPSIILAFQCAFIWSSSFGAQLTVSAAQCDRHKWTQAKNPRLTCHPLLVEYRIRRLEGQRLGWQSLTVTVFRIDDSFTTMSLSDTVTLLASISSINSIFHANYTLITPTTVNLHKLCPVFRS